MKAGPGDQKMEKTRRLMRSGYAFPCSCCDLLIDPRVGCGKVTCGGPFAGRSFPCYQGPLTKMTLATRCFRCGDRVEEAIVARDGGYVGCCEKHLNSTLPNNADTMIPVTEKPCDWVLPLGDE